MNGWLDITRDARVWAFPCPRHIERNTGMMLYIPSQIGVTIL